jgi:hypothetical protein
VLGKIDLDANKPAPVEEVKEVNEVVKEEVKEEPVKQTPVTEVEKPELKVLDKIDLSKLEPKTKVQPQLKKKNR